MKIPILTSIKDAGEQIEDDEIRDQFNSLLTILDTDLADQGYEAGILVEEASARLDRAIATQSEESTEKEDEGN